MTPVDHDMVSAYFDGELSPAEASRVERLVADDPAWAAALADLRWLDEALDAYTCPAAPRELSSRIQAVLRARRPMWARVLRVAVPLAAAAAVVLAVVLVGPWRAEPTGGPLTTPSTKPDTQLAAVDPADVDRLASGQLFFFANMEPIQTLTEHASLLDDATLDALAILEGPHAGR